MSVPSSERPKTSGLNTMPKHILQQIEALALVFSGNIYPTAQAPPKSFTKVPVVDTFLLLGQNTQQKR